jgi:hypothetical protein
MELCNDAVEGFLNGCFAAGIKDPVGYLVSKRPQVYDWLKGCFPRGILPTDIDGEVEIKGRFLRFEFKHELALRNGRVPKGQLQALRALVETKHFTVFIIGITQTGEPCCIEIYSAKGHTKLHDADRTKIRQYCAAWAKKSDSGLL